MPLNAQPTMGKATSTTLCCCLSWGQPVLGLGSLVRRANHGNIRDLQLHGQELVMRRYAPVMMVVVG